MLIAYLNMRTEILHLVKLVQSFFIYIKLVLQNFSLEEKAVYEEPRGFCNY